jgi:FkbM family methyltransferase
LETESIFDIPWAVDFNGKRQAFIASFLAEARRQTDLGSALDVGCGVGHFSHFLSTLNFRVIAMDGREENVGEARKRYPGISFVTGNVEDFRPDDVGKFEFTLCVGLLYHLENPFRAIRNLYSVTEKILLVETMCVPESQPVMELLDEGISENQGLNYVAFYPSESCLIKMLYQAGFPFVYRFKRLPEDELFQTGPSRKRQRTFLAASKVYLSAPNLILARELRRATPNDIDPWSTGPSRLRHELFQARVFASGMLASVRAAWVSKTFVPIRLPFGSWWIRRNDTLGQALMAGTFETAELAFAGRFLRPGMTVLDLGAHQGLYALLASRKVGPKGRVFAFEPSPRERRALRLNVVLNRCWNVSVQGTALGSENGEAEFFIVRGEQTGCNSLRPPMLHRATAFVNVKIIRLDDWLSQGRIDRVDFIRMDVEGAELTVLKGGAGLFTRQPRPVVLAEVRDERTRPWGYAAKKILEHLESMDYTWFRFLGNGALEQLDSSAEEFDGNFVACPRERLENFQRSFEVAPGLLR